jgi:SPFH domain / Band 7 family
MPRISDHTDFSADDFMPASSRWKRFGLVWGGLFLGLFIAFIMCWNVFFKYVPPGHHLVITAKNGSPLDPGERLANPGQKGIQREVLGEGWHFITPIAYTTEVEPNTIIPAGKIGILKAQGGRAIGDDRELAEEGERGIQRNVLPPGAYRINRHGYEIEEVDATVIKPGFVGVVRRLLRSAGKGPFADGANQKGWMAKVLQPGIYYLNTKEFDVLKVEVGIFQTSFHVPDKRGEASTAITFTSKSGFPISIDCTVEWEVLPERMPALVAEYGGRREAEKKVIEVQATAIGRDKGMDYGVQDFLEGATREKFQDDFTKELTRVCNEKYVTVHSAFIRRIEIPESFLKPIRDKKIAAETQITTKAKELTAETENQVQTEQSKVEQEVAKVESQTKLLVANIDQEVNNLKVRTEAEIEKMKEEYGNKIAAINSERTQVLGQAKAEVTTLVETAKGSLYKLQMDVFQSDNSAFLRYTMADQLNPDMVLRLFHSGSGTFWTNMGDKSMNLMMPLPGGQEKNDGAKPKPIKRDDGDKE